MIYILYLLSLCLLKLYMPLEHNYASPISINNIVDSLRKNGNKITKPTVIKYVHALLDAKIIYDCSRYDNIIFRNTSIN